ncbi:hypothetical protein HZC32_03435 [Candidatus Woesearchaeota archaeon]|nr:hypothetical protein [Candidatus Woesearchaeota archaeon]
MEELKAIRSDLDYIKKHLGSLEKKDKLNADDCLCLKEAGKEYREGKTKRLV